MERQGAPATVRAMKVDGGIGTDLTTAAQSAKELEAAGYSGLWTAETSHDPFFPLLLAAGSTTDVELGTSIAVAFARNPMLLANIGYDLQAYSQGRFVLGLGQPDQAPHHQALLDAVEQPGGPHAGDDPGHPGHLGGVERADQARLPRRLLHPHPHDAVLRPGPQPATATPRSSSPASAR